MRNLQELQDRRAAQSHRSFYLSPNTNIQSISTKKIDVRPPSNEMKSLFSKVSKLDNLVNPYSERKTALLQNKSTQKLSFFQTPSQVQQKASFIISRPRNVSFFEKKEKDNKQVKPFLDPVALKKMEAIKTKEKMKGRTPSPMIISEEGFNLLKIFFL